VKDKVFEVGLSSPVYL